MIYNWNNKNCSAGWLNPVGAWGLFTHMWSYSETLGLLIVLSQTWDPAPVLKMTATGGKPPPQWQCQHVCLTAVSWGSWTSSLPSHRLARRRREGNCLKGWRRGCCCLPGQPGGSWGDPPAPERNDTPSHASAQSQQGWNLGKKISHSEDTVELIAKLENLFLWNYTVFNNNPPNFIKKPSKRSWIKEEDQNKKKSKLIAFDIVSFLLQVIRKIYDMFTPEHCTQFKSRNCLFSYIPAFWKRDPFRNVCHCLDCLVYPIRPPTCLTVGYVAASTICILV